MTNPDIPASIEDDLNAIVDILTNAGQTALVVPVLERAMAAVLSAALGAALAAMADDEAERERN